MSVARCSCGRDYWKYPGASVKGSCSIECHTQKKSKRRKKAVDEALAPKDLLTQWRMHLAAIHQTADLNAWFPECSMCEYLEGKYNAALGEVA